MPNSHQGSRHYGQPPRSHYAFSLTLLAYVLVCLVKVLMIRLAFPIAFFSRLLFPPLSNQLTSCTLSP